jgi:signal transduction histidine kinase
MITLTLIAAVFSLFLTLYILWVNPRRFSTQVFASLLIVQTTWLGCIYRAMQIGELAPSLYRTDALEFWFRTNGAVISFLPATMWLLKNAILANNNNRRMAVIASLPGFAISGLLVALCMMPSFVTSEANGTLHRGLSYYVYSGVGIAFYAICVLIVRLEAHNVSGIKRVELQFLALNAGTTALLLLLLNAAGNVLYNRVFNRISIFIVLGASIFAACALVTHKVFNAKELTLHFAQRIILGVTLSAGIFAFWQLAHLCIAAPFDLLLSIAASGPCALWFEFKSRQWFDLRGEQRLVDLRRELIELARTSSHHSDLVQSFQDVLAAKFGATRAVIMQEQGGLYLQGEGLFIEKSSFAYRQIAELAWATPESVERLRHKSGLSAVKGFLSTNELGLVIASPSGSATPSLLIAFSRRANETPYTFPEIERAQNVGELIDGVLLHCRLSGHAALKAKVEYFSLVSRGLAHDLRNLLTPISEFVLHTRFAFSNGSVESLGQLEASRAVNTISAYIRETLSFSRKLHPQFGGISISALLNETRDVLLPISRARGIELVISLASDSTLTVDPALIQRLLVNLVQNGIDASNTGQQVHLTAALAPRNRVNFVVRDDGLGIDPEMINSLNEGELIAKMNTLKTRGHGIGLSIAHSIAALHGGTISIESVVGKGTTVTVEILANPTQGGIND